MKWRLPALLLLAVSLFADNVRLYLKDGSYQLVREYQVLADRVKYLSAERGEWEEIPLDLVDLNRTKQEVAEIDSQRKQEAKEDAEEEQALREEKQQASYVPDDPGGYYVHGDKLEPLKQADLNVSNSKKRTVLKILSPVPLVSGKNTVEIEGASSSFRIDGDRPEFYFRLTEINGFAMIRLAARKNARLVETVTIEAVTNEKSEQRDIVPTFTKQVGDQLYKIWSEKTLLPGEYALIEFSAEQGYLQVWDFGVGEPAAKVK